MSFFSIRLKEHNTWLGKRNLSYFILDDDYFVYRPKVDKTIGEFGVTEKYRRVFSSTDEIRRSLRTINRQTVSQTVQTQTHGFTLELLARGKSLGTFSRYVVVDLADNKAYPLDDVIQGVI
jgi:hypothetical protein